MTNTWPPQLADVKNDAGVTGDVQDSVIARRLAAAIAWVQNTGRPDLNYTGDILSCAPPPDDDVWQGTVMLAVRLLTRRRSPDGMVSLGDMGVGRIASVDPDIERLLGVGRWVAGEFA